jgi:hypothetical protein
MPTNDFVFYLSRSSYKRIRLLGWLLVLASLTTAFICVLLAGKLWSSYIHTFTLYLKWQDALFATLCYISLVLVGASVMVIRFQYALRAGFYQGMFNQEHGSTLIVRDLSSKNLSSIYWAVGTTLSCFIAALVGLLPEILLGWIIHLPQPALVVTGIGVAVLLSLLGLIVTVIAAAFILIGWIGCVSFCRNMGAPQTYQLDKQTTLRLDGSVLSISHPDQQEAVFELNLLDAKYQRYLLSNLNEYWLDAKCPWKFGLGEEIEAVQMEADRFTILV